MRIHASIPIKRLNHLVKSNEIAHVLDLGEAVDRHEFSETIWIINNFTASIHKLAKSY